MALKFERKLPIILFFVFLMLTTIGVMFYQNTISLQDSLAMQRRTQDLVGLVDETSRLAFEMHSAFSTFMLVSNNTYLDRLENAKPKIRQNVERLRVLAAENQAQKDEVNRLDQALKEYVSTVSAKIDRRKIEGPAVGEEELLWPEGKALLDQIRVSGDRLKAIDTESLRQKDKSNDLRFTITVWVLILSSLAGIISLGLANLTVLSEIRKRRSAEQELIHANEGLERNVSERTIELKEANDRLLEVGLERESILFSEKEARKEAEIANRLRDEFMASVSHELRTPLNSILGWARLMKGGTLDKAQSEKALTTIIKNSETQNRLIEDLLDVARVISGKLQLDIASLDPKDLVSQSIDSVRPSADARNISMILDDHLIDTSRSLDGDKNRLIQVFTNLLGNAIKFSHEGTSIFVSASTNNDELTVRIQDQGRGISREFLPMVFERFRQDLTNKSNNGGLGLGLAIVRNLVEMHHGSVHAESPGEDKGATFTIVLPLAKTSREDLLEL